MAGELFKPHDHLFRTVFREESEAAGLLRAYLPEAVAGELRWSSLKRQDVSFIDDLLRASEADLLYAVRRKVDDTPAWMYVLFEHQSTPDRWLRLRLLKYSIRIWERDRRQHPEEEHLRPIVPFGVVSGPARLESGARVLRSVCAGRAGLAGDTALRASAAGPDAGRAGRSARRGARADRADGADGGVSGELAGAGAGGAATGGADAGRSE